MVARIGHWDVVIVGAGSAGCALANRLSADHSCRILLLEAGPDYPPEVGWPRTITHGKPHDVSDYLLTFNSFYTATQSLAFVTRGRVVGGSSAVNGGFFFRGLAEDYDSWGSPLWSYEALLPFLRAEERDLDFPDSPIHGSAGAIPVRRAPRASWLAHQVAFYEAVVRMGFGEKPDLAESPGEGIGPIPMNIIDGYRTSAAIGYIDPVRNRPNLTIAPNTRALRVVIEGRKAVGVLAEQDGRPVRVDADEVVLCAGGLVSPHLLVLSGIGPADTLRQLGLPIIVDLPGVGQNARDHPLVGITVATPEQFLPTPGDPTFQTLLVLSSPSGSIRNDMHLLPSFVFEDTLEYKAVLQRGLAAGHLEFRSANPEELPRVHFRYLEPELDRVRFRESVRLILELLDQPSLSEMGKARIDPTDEDLASDATLDLWIENELGSCLHTSGTCRMGPAPDPEAVVDFEGRVHGIENLRIADLSISPDIVRAPPNATAIVIGERMADLMLTAQRALRTAERTTDWGWVKR